MNTSLIGNYIHYKYLNYRRYGLQLKGAVAGKGVLHKGSLNKYLTEARSQARGLTVNQGAAAKALSLENYLNQFQLRNKSGSTIADDSDLEKVVMQHFNEIFQHLSADDFDWSTFTLTPAAKQRLKQRKVTPEQVQEILGSSAKLLKIETLTKSTLGSADGQAPIAAYNRQVANLRAGFEALKQNLGKGSTSLVELENNIKALELAKQQMSKVVNVTSGSGIFYTDKNGVSQQYSLRDLIRLTAHAIYAQSCISILEGTFFESVIAGASSQLQKVGAEGFEDVINSLVSGAQTGRSAIQHTNFSKQIAVKDVVSSSHHVTKSNGVVSYTVGAQQGKMDVQLIGDKDQLSTGVTAKSYDLSTKSRRNANIDVVNNTTLIYMFQKKGEFLNHYLNQTVDTVPITSVVTQTNEIMKQMILLQAIIGGGIRIKEVPGVKQSGLSTTIFALNDKSRPGGIRIMPVSQLFSKLIENHEQLFEINLDTNKTWRNEWKPGPKQDQWDRITSLLHEVHSYKIQASISKDAFAKI